MCKMEIYNSDLTDGKKLKKMESWSTDIELNNSKKRKLEPMRIIIGNNGMWFTPDHYITIIRTRWRN